MKHLPAGLALSLIAAVMHGQIIVENFNTNGSLVGTTPTTAVGTWTQISATSTPALSVAGGVVSLAASSGQSAQLNFSASDLSAGTIYAGITFRVTGGSISSTADNLSTFFGFRSGSGYELGVGVFRPSGTAQAAGALATTTTQFQIGFGDGSSLALGGTRWGSVSSTDTSYRLVIGWDLTNNSAQLWLNPTAPESPSIAIASGLIDAARGIYLRQGSATHGQIAVSNLQVSTDFYAAASAIPEPSTYAMGAGLVALAAAWRLRRQKRNGSR